MLSFADALIGGLAGAGLLWIVGEGYFKLRGREGMGLGDVKMMGMVGIFLGLKRTMLTILLGSVLGSVIGIVLILATRKGRDYELPFGAFLAGGALIVVLLRHAGDQLVFRISAVSEFRNVAAHQQFGAMATVDRAWRDAGGLLHAGAVRGQHRNEAAHAGAEIHRWSPAARLDCGKIIRARL